MTGESEGLEWLRKHVGEIRSIDPGDEDFDDLAPVLDALRDVRLVLLGEPSHGDGATFHAKTRLIKCLHQELGFDVLAFEGDFFGCDQVWKAIRDGESAVEQFRRAIDDTWSTSEQMQSLIAYLDEQAASERPLEFCGFDCQSSEVFGDKFREQLQDFLFKPDPFIAAADWERHGRGLDHYCFSPRGRDARLDWEEARAALTGIGETIKEERDRGLRGESECAAGASNKTPAVAMKIQNQCAWG